MIIPFAILPTVEASCNPALSGGGGGTIAVTVLTAQATKSLGLNTVATYGCGMGIGEGEGGIITRCTSIPITGSSCEEAGRQASPCIKLSFENTATTAFSA